MSTTVVTKVGTKNADQVVLLDSSGNQVDSFGGGTQYTDGDAAPTHPVGSTITFNDGGTMTAVSDTAPLPVLASIDTTGLATSAGQTTGNNILGTIDADTGNISTKIDTLAGAVSGSEFQVDVLTMPTVTVTATNLDVQSGGADLATSTQAAAIQTSVELIDDTVATLGTTTYTEATTKGITIGAVRRDADTTLVNTTNEIGPLQMDANGRLKVEAFSGEALPVTDNSSSLSVDWNGTQPVTGSGNATGALRVELPTNGTGVIATVSTVSALGTGTTGPQKAEDVASAGGDMGVAIMAARLDTPVANAGVSNDGDYTTPILDNYRKLWVTGTVPEDTAHVAGEALTVIGARRIDTAATSAGSSGDWATMDASAEGALWSTLTPTTTSGCSTFRSLDLDETEEEVKATAGNVYGYYFYNAASSVRYLKFYNATAASVSVGTTTPLRTYPVPAGAAGHVALPYPIGFSTAISVAVTTGLADNDTGAPGTNDFIINIDYK